MTATAAISPTRADVLVVGGGPAGLYAAQLLARAGIGVVVLEEHEVIGQPVHCTGILGREALELPGVPRQAVLGWAQAARFESPVGHRLDYIGPEREACVVDRGRFDAGLADLARAAGATVRVGARVVSLDFAADAVTARVEGAGGPWAVRGKVCVLACGAAYRFQRLLGWGRPPLFLGAAQTERPAHALGVLRVLLRAEVGPAGFGWLVPIQRAGQVRAKVGVMAARGARRVLGDLLDELVEEGTVAQTPGEVVTRLLPLSPLARTAGDRVLAIGDAAGLVKPTTGGGIYYGLLSAGWAADTLMHAFARRNFSVSTLSEYERTWRARLGPELSVGLWFRRLANRLTAADLDEITLLGTSDGLLPVVRASARFDWHRSLILRALRHPGVVRIVGRRLLAAVREGAGAWPLLAASQASSGWGGLPH